MKSKDRTDKFRDYIYDIEKDKIRAQKENHLASEYDNKMSKQNFKRSYDGVI